MTSQNELIPLVPGDLLRYEREKRGFSLDRAAELSRIKPAVLSAIEYGDTGEIPAVYLRGYIRNYARFLGLDPNQIDQHMEHVKSSRPEVRSVFEVNTNRAGTDRWLKATSYLAASALIATLAWQFTHEAVRFSQGDSQLTSGSAVSVQAEAGDEVSESDSAQFSKGHLNASIASIEMISQGRASSPQQTGQVDGSSDELSAGQHKLRVMTSADTWIEILDGSGAHLEMDLVRAGETRDYRAQSPFQILIGRASAVAIEMDNQSIDLAPYTRGNVARMTLGEPLMATANQETEDSSH